MPVAGVAAGMTATAHGRAIHSFLDTSALITFLHEAQPVSLCIAGPVARMLPDSSKGDGLTNGLSHYALQQAFSALLLKPYCEIAGTSVAAAKFPGYWQSVIIVNIDSCELDTSAPNSGVRLSAGTVTMVVAATLAVAVIRRPGLAAATVVNMVDSFSACVVRPADRHLQAEEAFLSSPPAEILVRCEPGLVVGQRVFLTVRPNSVIVQQYRVSTRATPKASQAPRDSSGTPTGWSLEEATEEASAKRPRPDDHAATEEAALCPITRVTLKFRQRPPPIRENGEQSSRSAKH